MIRVVPVVRAGPPQERGPGDQGSPGGPPQERGPGGPAIKAVPVVNPISADPVDPVVLAIHPTSADLGGPGGPPGDFRGPVDAAVNPTSADLGWARRPTPGDFNRPGSHDWRPPWNPQDNDWRGRFHGAPWGDGLPPWGWGAPPPPIWDGPLPPAWGPPPPPINYFGYNEQPVWDPGYNQWGFYFFGIWIPLPV